MQRVKIYYTDGSEEILEGTVTLTNGCFKIERARESDVDAIIATIDVTDSQYIPLTSIKKLMTIP